MACGSDLSHAVNTPSSAPATVVGARRRTACSAGFRHLAGADSGAVVTIGPLVLSADATMPDGSNIVPLIAEVVPVFVELEVAIPHLRSGSATLLSW